MKAALGLRFAGFVVAIAMQGVGVGGVKAIAISRGKLADFRGGI
jgi:hypothetical protein